MTYLDHTHWWANGATFYGWTTQITYVLEFRFGRTNGYDYTKFPVSHTFGQNDLTLSFRCLYAIIYDGY